MVGNADQGQALEASDASVKNSLIGGQLQYHFSDNLSAFVQGTAHFNRAGDAKAKVDWAYLSYDFANDFTVRAGKFQIPFLNGTELRKIGYTRTWARPLIPGNGSSGFVDYSGAELLHNYSSGDWHWRFQAAVGKPDHQLNEIDGKAMQLFAVSLQHNTLTLRSALARMNYSVYTPTGRALDDSADSILASIEAEWLLDQYIINLGYSDSNADITPDDSMMYASFGYQWENFRPFIFSVVRDQVFTLPARPSNPNGPPPPPPLIPPPVGDSRVISTGLGVRWDTTESIAIKAQLQHDDVRDETRPQQGVIETQSNILSIVVEGVF